MSDIRIVLIEDHDLARIGLRTALQQREGIKVIGEAANGFQGLKLLQTAQPDVAIVDIGLPDMDGIELTRKFRQYQSEADIGSSGEPPATKILVLTMHDSEDAVLAAFAAGADSYCMKDISIDRLSDAIQSTHEGNSWVDPAIASVVLYQVRQHSSDLAGTAKTVAIAAIDPEYEQTLEAYPLTERELEILELIVAGHSNAAIAEKLYITLGTVKTHVRNILSKLCADDRTQAAVRALRAGLVS
ncbi:DNA-binding response regulator [Leptolyngbya sp. 'hensonii']|uniref:response regulator n=1 Tax=Leptolyngbya sp. 'hensonii' TaxID=1922337 RepID=UPI00094FDB8D|nr:response regulator transcription factor [Leptolyngbya sp. 'hensonii']OLP17738.1 DNA-binding response regulator [Leptolyngbya sp. 'hensonii']